MSERRQQRAIWYADHARPRVWLPAAWLFAVIGPLGMWGWHAHAAGSPEAWIDTLRGYDARQVGGLITGLVLLAVCLALTYGLRLTGAWDPSVRSDNRSFWLGLADSTGLGHWDSALLATPVLVALLLLAGGVGSLFEVALAAVVSLGVLLGAHGVERVLVARQVTTPVAPQPAGPGSEVVTLCYQWQFAREIFGEGAASDNFTLDFLVSRYHEAELADHELTATGHYARFVDRDLSAPELWAVAAELSQRHRARKYTPFEEVRHVLAFVAGFGYAPRPADQGPRYPLEALYEQQVGDACAVILAGNLLRLLGHEPVLFLVGQEEPRQVFLGLTGAFELPTGVTSFAWGGTKYYGVVPCGRSGFWPHLPPGVALADRPWAWAGLGGPAGLDWRIGQVRPSPDGVVGVPIPLPPAEPSTGATAPAVPPAAPAESSEVA